MRRSTLVCCHQVRIDCNSCEEQEGGGEGIFTQFLATLVALHSTLLSHSLGRSVARSLVVMNLLSFEACELV